MRVLLLLQLLPLSLDDALLPLQVLRCLLILLHVLQQRRIELGEMKSLLELLAGGLMRLMRIHVRLSLQHMRVGGVL